MTVESADSRYRTAYSSSFFVRQSHGSRRSADEVVPVLQKLFGPASVVDVGCGTGTWLAAFARLGVADIVGVDGEWLDPKLLEVPRHSFISADLTSRLDLRRRFDLVLSLEVAEHLPPDRAAAFVQSLVNLGRVVVFSAAVPGQGGTNHLNEQWPEYWAALFAERGYAPVDCIRPVIWSNERVDWWYAQNMLVYADQSYLNTHATLREAATAAAARSLSLVHPRGYTDALATAYLCPDPERVYLSVLVSRLPRATMNAFRNRCRLLSRHIAAKWRPVEAS